VKIDRLVKISYEKALAVKELTARAIAADEHG
jgi:hypothetical protein